MTTEKIDSKYFLPYQVEAITDEARLVLWEKSIRVGATFAMAMRAVRRRMMGKGNYLHTSVNERIAKSFIGDCRKFCKIYDAAASDVTETEVWNEYEKRRETAFEIHFPEHDVSIKAFSSNPDAIRGEGGEVGIDEITSHRNPEEMAAAAGGRAMWGYPLTVWTSHKGVNTWFNQTIQQERAKGSDSRWKLRTTTLPMAIKAGLLDKINEVSGANMTEEDFIADTIAMVGGQEAYEQECLCKPREAGDDAIKWQYIDKAKTEYDLYRKHIEGNDGFDVESWARDLIEELRACDRVAFGYDVARTGHLSAVPMIGRMGGKWRLRGLLTMHKRKFGLQREIIERVMRAVPGSVGAGDKTGLGMQVCEELTDAMGESRFAGMNFGTMKGEIGTRMVRVFEDANFELPVARQHEDIHFDLHGIQTESLPSGRVRFYETANPINKLSHCDIAWAIGLALFVGEEDSAPGIVTA